MPKQGHQRINNSGPHHAEGPSRSPSGAVIALCVSHQREQWLGGGLADGSEGARGGIPNVIVRIREERHQRGDGGRAHRRYRERCFRCCLATTSH
jgi:hypothetical protein